jgi:hypothetical protein
MRVGLAISTAVTTIFLAGCAGFREAAPAEQPPRSGATMSWLPANGKRPAYDLEATIDPEGGAVRGRMTVRIPERDRRPAVPFRVFPNDERLATGFAITGGDATNDDLEDTVLSVSRGTKNTVTLAFEYTLPQLEEGSVFDLLLGGNALEPDAIGLLGRHENGAALGHWFPTYLPEGVISNPEVRGFGDLGNFPASDFRARLRVPTAWELATSGITVSRSVDGRFSTYEEQGSRLRDFAVYLGRDLQASERTVDGVTIRAWAHADHAGRLTAVTETAAEAVRVFGDAFGTYPWPELDVVDTPLGVAVGGMEWPAMVWIGSDAFAGQIPGVGALGKLLGTGADDDPLREIVGNAVVKELGLGPVVAGLETTADFVLVHEVAHQWWFALVGSDSLASPVLDEPLAQYSSCLFWRQQRPHDAEAACETNVTGQYTIARSIGIPDAAADRPSDRFESPLQYGAVVYGKAPGFYLELEKLLGRNALLAGLRRYVRANSFGIATDEDLLRALTEAAPRHAPRIRRLWRRWMQETHGDEDLAVAGSPLDGLLGGLGGQAGSLELGRLLDRLLDELAEDRSPRR